MSTPEHLPTTAEGLVADIDRRLRRHLRRADRRAITDDLLADLRAAEADGRDPLEMIGGDVDDFVRRTVEEGGYVVVTRDTPRVALLGTLVAVPAVVAGYLVALAVVQPLWTAVVSAHVDIPHPTGAAAGWVAMWVVGVLAVFTALAVCLHGRPAARTTLVAAAVTVPLAATVAIACSITVVEVLTTTPGSIAIQVAGVLLPLVGPLALARRWGLHRAQSFAV